MRVSTRHFVTVFYKDVGNSEKIRIGQIDS